MRTLKFLLQKEFRQIFRDKGILAVIFMMPTIQLLILPWAADYEIKNIKLAVVDHDKAELILEVPPSFEKDLVKEDEAKLFLAVNAINGVKAGLGSTYLRSIIQDFNGEVRLQWIQFPRFSPET